MRHCRGARKHGIDLKFDVIGLGVSGEARSQLQCVADKGNGTYYDADNAKQIEDTLSKLATRAFRPFKLTGTLVAGTLEATAAPTVEPGQYVDTFAAGKGVLHYRLPRSAVGSTVHAGLTTEATGSSRLSTSVCAPAARMASTAEAGWDKARTSVAPGTR